NQRQVLRSTDMGDSWSAIDVPVNTDLQAVSFVDSQLGYACGTNSQVVKTTDAGLTWAPVTRPSATNYVLQAMEFVDANTGWASSILPLFPVVTSSRQPTVERRGVSKLSGLRTRSFPVTW